MGVYEKTNETLQLSFLILLVSFFLFRVYRTYMGLERGGFMRNTHERADFVLFMVGFLVSL